MVSNTTQNNNKYSVGSQGCGRNGRSLSSADDTTIQEDYASFVSGHLPPATESVQATIPRRNSQDESRSHSFCRLRASFPMGTSPHGRAAIMPPTFLGGTFKPSFLPQPHDGGRDLVSIIDEVLELINKPIIPEEDEEERHCMQ